MSTGNVVKLQKLLTTRRDEYRPFNKLRIPKLIALHFISCAHDGVTYCYLMLMSNGRYLAGNDGKSAIDIGLPENIVRALGGHIKCNPNTGLLPPEFDDHLYSRRVINGSLTPLNDLSGDERSCDIDLCNGRTPSEMDDNEWHRYCHLSKLIEDNGTEYDRSDIAKRKR